MEKPLFYGKYSNTPDMMNRGYALYLKKMQGKRNLFFIIFFAALGVYYLYLAITGSRPEISAMLSFVCFAMAALAFYNPRKAKRSVSELFEEISGDVYTCEIYDQKIIVSTDEIASHNESVSDEQIEEAKLSGDYGIAPTEIPIDKNFNAFESDEFFVVGTKNLFYVLPKDAFENSCEMSSFFENKCGKKFFRE